MKALALCVFDGLPDRQPTYALVADVDLVIVRYDDEVSVLYGRCAHRGALMSDGHIDGDNIICGLHGWDYRVDTGVSEYNNSETLAKFSAWIDDGEVLVDEDEIREPRCNIHPSSSHGHASGRTRTLYTEARSWIEPKVVRDLRRGL